MGVRLMGDRRLTMRNAFRNHQNGVYRRDRGAALVEFALAFPLQLLLTLGILQLGLLYIGHQVVGYSAFCAARAALVGESHERAAEIACAGVAGKTGVVPLGGYLWFPGIGILPTSAASIAKTQAVVLDNGSLSGEVLVQVSHDFELVVPVVNRMFAFGEKFLWLGSPKISSSSFLSPGGSASAKYGAPHLRIVKRCVLPAPWKRPVTAL